MSSLNFTTGQTVPNAAVVPVSCVDAACSTVTFAVAQPVSTSDARARRHRRCVRGRSRRRPRLQPSTPHRVVDTRLRAFRRSVAGTGRASLGSVPADTVAANLNVTAISPTAVTFRALTPRARRGRRSATSTRSRGRSPRTLPRSWCRPPRRSPRTTSPVARISPRTCRACSRPIRPRPRDRETPVVAGAASAVGRIRVSRTPVASVAAARPGVNGPAGAEPTWWSASPGCSCPPTGALARRPPSRRFGGQRRHGRRAATSWPVR